MRTPGNIAILVALNVAVQAFDGIATYLGWAEFGEGNPILRAGFETWGAGPTLLAAKLFSVVALFSLARLPHRTLVGLALGLTFGVYAAFSCVPWSFYLFARHPAAMAVATCLLP